VHTPVYPPTAALRARPAVPLTLDALNAASADEFVRLLDGIYEHSPWVAERAAPMRPFTASRS
jgi:2-oxo-4-hydroxy-4-carboxy--5-ureidoimidazoline (OHCU) decarboxylase